MANRQHALKEAQELLELQLCKAPHWFFDPHNEVRDIFLGFHLHCPEHMPDPAEERFQDILNYLEEFRNHATLETIKQTSFEAINAQQDLF